MSLVELDDKIKRSYDSNNEDVTESFYIPALEQTKYYDRIAGYFTSSSFVVSLKGILGIIKNDGHIRMLVSPVINDEDIKTIINAEKNPYEYISELLVKQLELDEEGIYKEYRAFLAHLVAKGILELRIVIVKQEDGTIKAVTEDDPIFHQKIGILKDENGNIVTFSGSINETLNAWNRNIEEFKTFKSWVPGLDVYVDDDLNSFESYWNNGKTYTETMALPRAVEEKLIQISKNTDFEDIKRIIKKREKIKPKLYDSLFWYQKEAISAWKENNHCLLFSMATGTGKTRTALGAIETIIENEPTLVVIATPQSSLNQQWKNEIENLDLNFGKILVCDSSNSRYKTQLETAISNLNLGIIKKATIITTHATACSEDFIYFIKNRLKSNRINTIFVGDEVHGMGSRVQRKALLEEYKYRIGLSATPSRWFDDEGSNLLIDYFKNKTYEFGIDKALIETNPLTGLPFLTKYKYLPKDVYLNDVECNEYKKYTEQLIKLAHSDDSDDEVKEKKERIMELRADIIKQAEDKLNVLSELLDEISSEKEIENTIIFTSPKQLNGVLDILFEKGIMATKLTKDEGVRPEERFGGLSQREYIIDRFKKKIYKVIVAIKCMDEGIDIPSADTAILMSSTTNPREYIQRIGRVIRRYSDKKEAYIYDLVCKSYDVEINKSIRKNELRREEYIAQNACNSIEAISKIYGGD